MTADAPAIIKIVPTEGNLPYWQLNVPESLRTEQCPDFLKGLNDKDTEILSTPDADYHYLSWQEVKDVISENRIDEFQRSPSDLRLYKAYTDRIKKKHGKVMDFIIEKRLGWDSQEAKGEAFTEPEDIKVIYNDWPYGLDKRVVHLVVWTKFNLDEEEKSGNLTPEMKEKMHKYVEKTFYSGVPKENVMYFKNWAKLKTVKAVEHFHVMMYEPDVEFLKEVTGGDAAMQQAIGADRDLPMEVKMKAVDDMTEEQMNGFHAGK